MCGVERGWGKQSARPVPIREALLRDQSQNGLTVRPVMIETEENREKLFV